MSSVDPFVPGATVLQYRLIQRVGPNVWQAEDTRGGKQVAVKILTKQLPKDPAKRDAMIKDVRVSGAIYHTFLVPIVEIVPAGDVLLLVMDFVDGQPLSKHLGGKALDRSGFFRLACQLTDVLRFLHAKNLVHQN